MYIYVATEAAEIHMIKMLWRVLVGGGRTAHVVMSLKFAIIYEEVAYYT